MTWSTRAGGRANPLAVIADLPSLIAGETLRTIRAIGPVVRAARYWDL